ncbi:PREDICTED: uncharacterized protein LOC106821357 [Priapulus caudatus]|uniref:Uncharacterized protein LOC106821357 n=1 Tax=Priapulus caudatus TaxID=37621 RepID=A0ABM1FAY8_PRICU|nr:PREDICTED: uncharacterized protein LOC106821357 [Priapulus caudatus]
MAPFTPPFYNTACDYFGPYTVKIGKNKTTKHYGVIFTCLNTRAVHLELSVDCSSMEFLQVLRRFFAIRGCPRLIQSDNGTQMVGAERQLREMVKGWSRDDLKEFYAERQVIWKFVTPLAPHQNGCAEALVKSCKHAIRKSIGDQHLTPLEFYTCLQEIANLVNERPIGRHPNDPDDGNYICPHDILLRRASNTEFHKDRSAPVRIPDIELSLCNKLSIRSGRTGRRLSCFGSEKEMESPPPRCKDRRCCGLSRSELRPRKVEHRQSHRGSSRSRWKSTKRQS